MRLQLLELRLLNQAAQLSPLLLFSYSLLWMQVAGLDFDFDFDRGLHLVGTE
jgi:hypothetical protein